jgi:hypothetical protein
MAGGLLRLSREGAAGRPQPSAGGGKDDPRSRDSNRNSTNGRTPMSMHLKRKIAFALLMGVVTTGIISFVLLALNVGFSEEFALKWLRSWVVGYVIVIPAILLIGPWLQALVERVVQ